MFPLHFSCRERVILRLGHRLIAHKAVFWRALNALGRPVCFSAVFFIFIFIFFIFVFYKNIFLFSKFRRIYPGRPAAGGPSPGRPAAGRQGLFCKKFRGKFAPGSLKDRPPGSGAAGPQAARQRGGGHRPAARQQGGRLPLRYIRVWLPPHPSFASLKIQKKEKRGGVRERGEAAKSCWIFKPATAGN